MLTKTPKNSVFTRLCGRCPHPVSGIRWMGRDTKLRTLPFVVYVIRWSKKFISQNRIDSKDIF